MVQTKISDLLFWKSHNGRLLFTPVYSYELQIVANSM